jgi:3-isopropylmalate/(R)-2-methylmalate dehydratase small subunit
MQMVEHGAATIVTVDLESMTIEAGPLRVAATMPPAARDALTSGLWDATGLLLEHFDDVRAIASGLPYTRGFAPR